MVYLTNFFVMDSKQIDLFTSRLGYCTTKLLRGIGINTRPNPSDGLVLQDGKIVSDISLVMHLDAKDAAGIVPLVTPQLAERPHVDASSPVGSRHVSLSTAFNSLSAIDSNIKSEADDLKSIIKDTSNSDVSPSNPE